MPDTPTLLANASAGQPMTRATFDHSTLTRRYWHPELGPCHCEHCKKLSDVEPSPTPSPARLSTEGTGL